LRARKAGSPKASSRGRPKAAKQARKKGARLRAKARPQRPAIAVGDAVRVPAEAAERIARTAPAGRSPEPIEGLVCAIRAIATGKLVSRTRGSLQEYVLEILHERTFNRRFSSPSNTGGPAGAATGAQSPSWRRAQALLRHMAERKELLSEASGGLSEGPFAGVLDGWRVVKVRAEEAELVE